MNTIVSVIDLGSARTKFFVGRLTEKGDVETVAKGKFETGLLGKLQPDGILDPDAVTSLVHAVREILETIHHHGSTSTIFVATEALRKATNQDEIVGRMKSDLGLDVNILTPHVEADILFSGVKENKDHTIPVADIGGGSVQLAWAPNQSISIPTGTFALEKRFQKSGEIPTMEMYDAMRKEVGRLIKDALNGREVISPTLIVGTTCMREFFDSAMCAAGITAQPKEQYTIEDINALFTMIAEKPYAELAKFYPSNPMFMYGGDKLLVNVQELMKATQAQSIIPTNDSVSTGIVRLASAEDGLKKIGITISNL